MVDLKIRTGGSKPSGIITAGKDNHEAVVEVVKKEYFAEENVPLPKDKTKHIIRKCTDADFDLPDDEPV